MAIDEDKLNNLLGRFVADLGAAMHAGNAVIGDRLRLYRGLWKLGPTTPERLAAHAGPAERYVREWLRGQAAGGYVSYDADAGTYCLSDEQALALADPAGCSPCLVVSFSRSPALKDEASITEAFRTGERPRMAPARPGRCSPDVSGSSARGTSPISSPSGSRPRRRGGQARRRWPTSPTWLRPGTSTRV